MSECTDHFITIISLFDKLSNLYNTEVILWTVLASHLVFGALRSSHVLCIFNFVKSQETRNIILLSSARSSLLPPSSSRLLPPSSLCCALRGRGEERCVSGTFSSVPVSSRGGVRDQSTRSQRAVSSWRQWTWWDGHWKLSISAEIISALRDICVAKFNVSWT